MTKFNSKTLKKALGSYSDRLTLALVPALAAVTPKPAGTGFEAPSKDIGTAGDVVTAVNNVAGFLFKIFLGLAVIFIIVAALFYLTAAGNQTQLDRAKNVLIYSIVAIVIALIAGGITTFVGDILGVK